jgi:hypothetical protein
VSTSLPNPKLLLPNSFFSTFCSDQLSILQVLFHPLFSSLVDVYCLP